MSNSGTPTRPRVSPVAGRVSLAAVTLLVAAGPAFAQLERVGPTNPAFGYPSWYQDRTGLTLEFCDVRNQTELDGGWCLLLPGDTTAPESFPSAFADEHFYWSASTTLPVGATGRATLVLALEGAFGGGPVVAGDQIVFGRVRVDIRGLPFGGDYRIYHPYGVWDFPNQNAGDRLFFTEDIGLACTPGDFSCALQSHVGPFLLASPAPGGSETPAVTGPGGKQYIADPGRIGPVTGSPLADFTASDGTRRNHNIFRIEGPNGFVAETTDFSLMGRIFTGPIPGRLTVDRASYALPGASAPVKLDVFATAFPTRQARMPASPSPSSVTPVLAFFPGRFPRRDRRPRSEDDRRDPDPRVVAARRLDYGSDQHPSLTRPRSIGSPDGRVRLPIAMPALAGPVGEPALPPSYPLVSPVFTSLELERIWSNRFARGRVLAPRAGVLERFASLHGCCRSSPMWLPTTTTACSLPG